MGRNIFRRVVLGAVCSLAVLAATIGQTIAATKQAKESASVAASVKSANQEAISADPTCQEEPHTHCHGAPIGGDTETGQAGTDRA